MAKKQKIIVKLGTSTLTKGTKSLSRRHMLEFAQQMAHLQEEGHELVLVTSGAVAAGREILCHPKVDSSLPAKQMFASIGQGRLMQLWAELFAYYDIAVGQVLLTHDDFSNRQRYLNVRDTINTLLSHQVIPIINENDAVATEEIKVGDNDNLSALVANLIAADYLILLTDQKGLYTADPRSHSDAELISVVDKIDEDIFALAGGSSKALGLGTGGMITKIQAAKLATQSGTKTIIAHAMEPHVLESILHGKPVGTLFKPRTTVKESRKRWLLSKKGQGVIHVDAGAEAQLSKKGASLLPVGIAKATQTFERGAIVQVQSPTNHPIAMGITNYSSDEIQKIIGARSDQIESRLGYSYGPEVIHRDNLALMDDKDETD